MVTTYELVVFAAIATASAIVVLPNKSERGRVDVLPPPGIPPPGMGLPGVPPPDLPSPEMGILRPSEPIAIDLTQDSGRLLYQLPGRDAWIHFEVTNRRDFQFFYQFLVSDPKGYVINVRPTQAMLTPGKSVRVDVLIKVPYSERRGSTNMITLNVHGRGPEALATRAALFTVGQQETDTSTPSCSTKVTKNCADALDSWKCQTSTWMAEVKFQDDESGILKITAQPSSGFRYGLFYAGTKEEVKVYYEASCCEKVVTITAVDLQGNREDCRINVANALTTGEIAAIVLGVFLLIALIAIIVGVICICTRRRRRSMNVKL